MTANSDRERVGRRGFLATSASSAAMILATHSAVEVAAQAQKPTDAPTGPPVNCAVIGLGKQGRDLLAALSRVPGVTVTGICDTYQPFLNRSKDAAPKATPASDYRQVLERKDVSGIFIATPTDRHRDIAVAALQAGKHVYCEAPLAHTVEDARGIALAAKTAPKQVFQVGQQFRSNPQHNHVWKFVRGAVVGRPACARAQWHKKVSWRATAPTPDREREMNWRLRRETSPGLPGEVGIHSIDTMNWFLRSAPVSVAAFGGNVLYQDGRTVPDTVQCVFEYPGGVRFMQDITLANSFDGSYELLMGDMGAVLLRGERAWLFKEADAPLEGWEVYARREPVGDETGIALVADATKILALGKVPGKDGSTLDPGKDALYYSVEAFANCIRQNKPAACGPMEGLQAAVTALKAHEASLTGAKIVFDKKWFELA